METNTYHHKIKNCDSLDGLFRLWKDKMPQDIMISNQSGEKSLRIDHRNNGFIKDGIVDNKQWGAGNNKKILFVLKEAYGENTDWDMTEWLRDKQPTLPIWKRIAKWTYGLQNTDKNMICPYVRELPDEQRRKALEQIAVINLKKSDGRSASNYSEITAYARADCRELMREFELIDPDIIVCGSTFHTLITEVFGMQPVRRSELCDNYFYRLEAAGKRRLFIDYYHPANHWDDLVNYYGIVNIYQQALIADLKNNLQIL